MASARTFGGLTVVPEPQACFAAHVPLVACLYSSSVTIALRTHYGAENLVWREQKHLFET